MLLCLFIYFQELHIQLCIFVIRGASIKNLSGLADFGSLKGMGEGVSECIKVSKSLSK